jgi:hypothetical protein
MQERKQEEGALLFFPLGFSEKKSLNKIERPDGSYVITSLHYKSDKNVKPISDPQDVRALQEGCQCGSLSPLTTARGGV